MCVPPEEVTALAWHSPLVPQAPDPAEAGGVREGTPPRWPRSRGNAIGLRAGARVLWPIESSGELAVAQRGDASWPPLLTGVLRASTPPGELPSLTSIGAAHESTVGGRCEMFHAPRRERDCPRLRFGRLPQGVVVRPSGLEAPRREGIRRGVHSHSC